MKPRYIMWVGLAVLSAALGYGAYTAYIPNTVVGAAEKHDPVIEYPARLDFGEREIGEVAVVPFAIANRGTGGLVIDEIRTNCSCTGMEKRREFSFQRVESLRLRAGESVALVMRVSVRGVPAGASMSNVVEFRTNDPAQRSARIEAVVPRVFAGVTCTPGAVAFGTVLSGTAVHEELEVWDTATTPRSVERVTSNLPEGILVKFVAAGPSEQHRPKDDRGVFLGHMIVDVDTNKPGDVHGAVEIHLAGAAAKSTAVRISGRVAAPVEINPSTVVLPRASAAGPLYSAVCICRSTRGKSLTLEVESVPAGFAVQTLPHTREPWQSVRITLDSKGDAASKKPQKGVIRFKATAGAEHYVVELPVVVQQ